MTKKLNQEFKSQFEEAVEANDYENDVWNLDDESIIYLLKVLEVQEQTKLTTFWTLEFEETLQIGNADKVDFFFEQEDVEMFLTALS